jgi:hypothetical protein
MPRLRYGLHLPTFSDPGPGRAGRAGRAARLGRLLPVGPHPRSSRAAHADRRPLSGAGPLAVRTDRRIRLSTTVTPLPQRLPRSWRGSPSTTCQRVGWCWPSGSATVRAEYAAFGQPDDPQVLAEVLDEGLDVLADLWSGERFAAPAGTSASTRSPSSPSPRLRIPLWVACTWPNGGRCGTPPLGRGGGRLAESRGSGSASSPTKWRSCPKSAVAGLRRAVRLVAVNPALPMRGASPPTPRLAGRVARHLRGRPARRSESAAQTAPCRRVQRP